MSILITGGTGFFGKALLRYWCEQDDLGLNVPSIYILSRSPELFINSYPEFRFRKWLTFYKADILMPLSIPEGPYTHILHAAADSTFGPKLSALDRYIQIVEGTRNILDFAVKNKVPRILFTSSGGAYGVQPQSMERIPESYNALPDPLNPNNSYGVAKRTAEHLCALYNERYGLETIIARCFAFVGRDLPLNVHFAIGNFIRDALTGKEIVIRGDGSTVRSYMDQRDLANWLNKMLFDGVSQSAYNVGSDEPITIKDLADLVRNVLAPNNPVIIQAVADAVDIRNRYVPLIDKAKSELGLTLNYTLEQSILDAAEYKKLNYL
jgi:dTDP-glucose 4,6-dehydratase